MAFSLLLWYTELSEKEGGTALTSEQIARINELARKSRTPEGLTDEEKAEQTSLRQRYVNAMKNSLRTQLENTVIVDEKGRRRKISRRG